MQRIRMSLPYFEENGWDAEVVTVDENYADIAKDELLLQSVPSTIKIHKVAALNKSWTSKIGLGSIALRSLWHYRKKVNELLKNGGYDLIYFSTTQFPVCILGPYWKAKFKVPYVIDMQDPWHSDYYEGKPQKERPNKYWFSYHLNKFLEPIALKQVDGLISVSDNYITDLKKRYPEIKNIPAATITFGAFAPDIQIAADNANNFPELLDPAFKNIVYIGRGGADLYKAITPLFNALAKGLANEPQLFKSLKFYFIGTSYAANGHGIPTILPLAKAHQVENNVIEITDRISYYHALSTLSKANALFIPGADDPAYTASKIYPYILTKKPLMAIFARQSSAINILKECSKNGIVLSFDDEANKLDYSVYDTLFKWAKNQFTPISILKEFENYSAKNLTEKQVDLFNLTIANFKTYN
jgi:hypothetical protein